MDADVRMYKFLKPVHRLHLKIYRDLMTKDQCYHQFLLTLR